MERGFVAKPFEEDIRQPEHEGIKYLTLLGLEQYVGTTITTQNHGVMRAEDFLDVCGRRARPALVGFADMDTTDPEYEATKGALVALIGKYIKGDAA